MLARLPLRGIYTFGNVACSTSPVGNVHISSEVYTCHQSTFKCVEWIIHVDWTIQAIFNCSSRVGFFCCSCWIPRWSGSPSSLNYTLLTFIMMQWMLVVILDGGSPTRHHYCTYMHIILRGLFSLGGFGGAFREVMRRKVTWVCPPFT